MHVDKIEIISNTGIKQMHTDCDITYWNNNTILSVDYYRNGKDIINYPISSLFSWRISKTPEKDTELVSNQFEANNADTEKLILRPDNTYKVSTIKQFIAAISNILDNHRIENDLDPTTIAIVIGHDNYFITTIDCRFIGHLYDIEKDPEKSYIDLILSTNTDEVLTADFIFNGELLSFDGELAVRCKIEDDRSKYKYCGNTLYIHNRIYNVPMSKYADSFIYCYIR